MLTGLAVGGSTAGLASSTGAGVVFGLTTDLGPAGGEPSIQDDGSNPGHIFITTPQGIGSTGNGIRFSESLDGGSSWVMTSGKPYKDIGGAAGGGDSDILIDPTRTNLYAADLVAAGAFVLRSTDTGATFPQSTFTGPENDRQWLTSVGPNVYLTYHDFAGNLPLIYGSTDQGASFQPLGFNHTGAIFAPGSTGYPDAVCNTLVSKPVTDADGTIYVLTNTSTTAENVQAGCATAVPLDRLYMSVSKDGGNSFTNYLVNDISAATTGKAKSGTWGKVFNQLAIDAGGNLYVAASGTLDGSLPLRTYLLKSTDHGQTWSAPQVIRSSVNGQLFPSIAAGQAGQLAVGYYQATLPNHEDTLNVYQFVVERSDNAQTTTPAWVQTVLTPLSGDSPHHGGICTSGLFCVTGGNRNLADFESLTVDQAGDLEVIIPADPEVTSGSKVTRNWFYKQTGGISSRMPPGPTNGNGTGNQTWVAGSRLTAPPAPVAAAKAAPVTQPIVPKLPPTSTQAGPGVMYQVSGLLILALVIVLGATGMGARGRRRR